MPFERGVIIIEVNISSPAENADLRPGDVILKVNGASISKPRDIRNYILENDIRPGDKLKFKIFICLD